MDRLEEIYDEYCPVCRHKLTEICLGVFYCVATLGGCGTTIEIKSCTGRNDMRG